MFGLRKKILTASITMDGGIQAYKDCNGCGVCTLSCPVWRQTHNVTLTLKGRVGALKGGAGVEDLKESLMSCVLCGACGAVCPMGIDTVGMTIKLREMLSVEGESPLVGCLSKDEECCHENEPVPGIKGEGFFLPGRMLRANSSILNRVKTCLENEDISQAIDDGADIGEAIEAGIYPSSERIRNFLAPLKGAKRLIVAEGIMQRHLREWLTGVKVTGLGLALLKREEIRSALRNNKSFRTF
jgi:ferredoxin